MREYGTIISKLNHITIQKAHKIFFLKRGENSQLNERDKRSHDGLGVYAANSKFTKIYLEILFILFFT